MSNLTTVRVYLEANSKDALIILQIENNAKYNCFFDYSPPIKDGNKWVTWFYMDILKRKR